MRAALHIDSATDEEMRRALVAWHYTSDFYKTPVLALDGLVVKPCGVGWNIESPPIEAHRAEEILQAARSADNLRVLKILRDTHRAQAEQADTTRIITEPATWDDQPADNQPAEALREV